MVRLAEIGNGWQSDLVYMNTKAVLDGSIQNAVAHISFRGYDERSYLTDGIESRRCWRVLMADVRSHAVVHQQHAFSNYYASEREGVTCGNRRGLLKAGLAGIAGLSLPELLRSRARAAETGGSSPRRKSVILVWMSGGPSQFETWDVKPTRPLQNRGPFGAISTQLPGVQICEHLPRQAAILDKFSLIRSVDARLSSHNPNRVMQTGNLGSTTADAKYPAIGSVVAKFHGPNHPSMPPYVAAVASPRKHLAFAGYLGKRFDPFIAEQATRLPVYNIDGIDTGATTGANLFQLPDELSPDRLGDRRTLMRDLDRLRSGVDQAGSMLAMDAYLNQAVEMVLGGRARQAFDLSREPAASRERYGDHVWFQQALLARRLVEAGVSFVTIGMNHSGGASWDTHGDNIPPYGGISKGMGKLLPLFDHAISTLVTDLDERGLLDDVLVIAMGEFGRTPMIGTQGSSDGRDHWPEVMSIAMAGGGLRHGQVIGATEADGGTIKDRAVTPADIAATIYRYMDVPLEATYLDNQGRPHYIVQNNGQPIRELF